MPIQVVQQISKARNGFGAYIFQCKKLQFCYCNWAGSSRGMNIFLQKMLLKFSKDNPHIEMIVSRRPGKHPIIRGIYVNGREKVICVRNLDPQQILKKAELLRNSSGAKLKKVKWPVSSMNKSVRGIWSPFHQQNTL
ncbi:hypothetical protein MERGE_002169 [Pneumocystis wakefieldiae]|uniref:Large ribosomal subunit protein mL43 n=1 Tax=Pneumocystis wakefieldiae TaxID=38082 RepID=A0A899FX49_9ASCO|nr:hypothetical protein MERGE_002169 [Pneumocystis wakefieldiae]